MDGGWRDRSPLNRAAVVIWVLMTPVMMGQECADPA
jgi:hypothetical protein